MIITVLISVVIVGAVLIPILGEVSDNGGGGSSGGGPDNVSDFSLTMKDLYGESYPWTTASGGYLASQNVPTLTISNTDFKQMPWETGQTTLDSYMDSAFWSIVEFNEQVGYQLDLMALAEYYSSYAQTFKDIAELNWPSDEQGPTPLPAYMMLLNVYESNNTRDVVSYTSPIGVFYGLDSNDNFGTQYGMMPNFPWSGAYIYGDESTLSATLTFFNDNGDDINVVFECEYIWNNETYTDGYGFHTDAVLFLGESDTGYMPLSLTNKDYEHLPLGDIEDYMTVNVQGGAVTQTGILIDKLNVVDTVMSDVADGINSDTELVWITDTLYDYTGQNHLVPNHPEYTQFVNGRFCYTSFTENKMNMDEVGLWYYEDDAVYTGYVAFMDEDSGFSWIINNTVALTSSAGGGGGSDSGSGGVSNAILGIIPLFVILGILIYAVQYLRPDNKL